MKLLILCACVMAATAMKLDKDCGTELQSATDSGLRGVFKPRCTDEGKYEVVQCHGSGCFCVSEVGEKISFYKEHISNVRDLDCNCARDEFSFKKTGKVGLSFNCKDNGNYDDIQCMGSVCGCVDNEGNFLSGSKTVNRWEIDQLNC